MTGEISLPMYDLAPLSEATDSLVRAIAAALPQGWSAGDRVRDDLASLWRAPALLLSQTCGYPLMTDFREDLAYVATPNYDLPGCEGPRYCSVILVREEEAARSLAELKGRRAAYNGKNSQSGYNCFRHAVAPLAGGEPFFSETLETGSHGGSVAAVAEGRADVATIDCATHGLCARHEPERLTGTRVLGCTASAPALPYVTKASAERETIEALRRALTQVSADPSLAATREALALTGFTVLPDGAYDEILEMERAAAVLGYPDLA